MMMLDPNTVQVLFADLQPQIVARSKTNPPEALARSAAVLAQVARLLHLPMHLSVVPEGGQRPELIPELARETEGVAQYPRVSASPFLDEATRAAIAATGRQHLVIAGFATEAVVLHGVRDAIAAGYQVHVPVDACGGMSSRTEDAAFRQIEAAGGITTSVVTLVTALAPDFSTDLGKKAFGILQSLRLAEVIGGEPDGKPVKDTFRADDGLEIVGEVRGQGDTALVFLHGWCGDREYWKHQVEVFAADYRVIALDQAGHGESGKGRKAWTADRLAGDVEAVVKALGLKRVILVGHSMGGSVALLAANRMPGTVVAVIGVDTLQNAEFKLPEEVRKSILDGVEKDFKGTVRVTIAGLLPENADAELKTWLQTKAEGQDPKMALALMRDLFGLDTRKLLEEAKVPVRCVNSAGGYKFFTPTAVETNKKYADFGAVTIDGVGHHPMLEKPDEFNRKLRDVLKELRPRSEPASSGTLHGRPPGIAPRASPLAW
ncbi:MAG TPA: alpha/beta fold hydrolase [Gemmataceae bacterium]|nr:alpha/beta fold hydrolase [Gemmataceae bacterium]